jgi:hypothetical protein
MTVDLLNLSHLLTPNMNHQLKAVVVISNGLKLLCCEEQRVNFNRLSQVGFNLATHPKSQDQL